MQTTRLALGRQLEPLQSWWATLALRERRLVALAAAVLLVYALWGLALQPAWRTTRELPRKLDQLDAELQAMRTLAAEARELRNTPPLAPGQEAAALKAATERLGGKGRLLQQGPRTVLAVEGVSGEELRAWLAEARSGARARPVAAQLKRVPQGYSGTITVTGSAP